MTRSVLSRVGAIASDAFRLVQDTFFVRLAVAAGRLRAKSRFLALLLVAALLGSLALALLSAMTVFSTLRPAATWPIGPAIAAFVAFLLILELCAASVMTILQALLRLSYDTGRHRIGTLLTLLTIVSICAALLDLSAGATSMLGVPLLSAVALTLIAVAFWFDRTYRRSAYPGFRDFHGDVVEARQHLSRASHGG